MTIWIPEISAPAVPWYLAIVEALEADVRNGHLHPGDRLPTHRELAQRLGISVGTTTRAYEEAEQRGLVIGEVGRGTFVAEDARGAPRYEIPARRETDIIDLTLNYPVGFSDEDEATMLAEALNKLSRHTNLHELTRYQPHVGLPNHRAAGADWIARTGLDVVPEEVVVCNGMQHALAVVVAALTEPGDEVLCAEITYPGMKLLAANRGLRLLGLAIDEQGIVPEALEKAAKKSDAKLLYVIPTIQNPTSITMPESRRRRIAEIASKHGIAILEDDTYGTMPSRPLKPIAFFGDENCYYAAGTTESIVPGLRIAYMRAHPRQIERLSRAMLTTMWMVAPLMAELAAAWIADGTADRLIARKRQEIALRQKLFTRHLGHLRHRKDPGAFHLWMELPERWRAMDFVHQAYRRNVAVTAADLFYAGEGEPPRAVRLCLGCTRDFGKLEEGLRILAELTDSEPAQGMALV